MRGNALGRPDHPDPRSGSRRRDPHQPAVRRRGGEEHPGELPRRQRGPPRPRCCSFSSSMRQPQARRPLRDRRAERRALRQTESARGSRKQLLSECNLHTVVRLPDGVFAPYTDIPTNLSSSRRPDARGRCGSTSIPPPEGRKKYSKTKPLRFEEFAECQQWWGGKARKSRAESEQAWRVPMAEIEAEGWNLDRKNPNRPDELSHRPPEEILGHLLEAEAETLALLKEMASALRGDNGPAPA